MKNHKTINTLKFAIPFTLAALASQNVKGQRWDIPPPLPTEKINMFINPYVTPQGDIFDALNSQTDKNNLIQSRINPDWTSTISQWIKDTYPNGIPPAEYPPWDCTNSSTQLMFNSINFGDSIYGGPGAFQGTKLIFNNYKGFNLDSILKRGGTGRDIGKLGLPMYTVSLTDSVTLPDGHAMNAVLTGDDITKWESWTFVEPQFDQINVQPGQAYVPKNCSYFMIEHQYIYNNPNGKRELRYAPVVFFTIKDGVPTFGGLNPQIKDLIITNRDKDKPVLEVYSTTNPNKLKGKASDANLKDFVYSADGGAEKPLTSDVEVDMGLSPGNHTIVVTARDYFRLVSDTIFTRTILTPTNYAPKITFITPQNGVKYDKDVRLKGNITDAENDPITASYSLDGGTQITIGQNFDNPLSLANGVHKIVVTASDPTHTGKYATEDSVLFEMNKTLNSAPIITINTPQNGVKYDKDVRLKGSVSDPEGDPTIESYSLDGGAPITIGQNFDNPLSLADGLHKIVVTASDPTHTGKYATEDSTMFEMKKATGIEPGPTLEDKTKYGPNPVNNSLHLFYKSNLSNNAYMTLTTLDGKPVLRQKINGATEGDLDMSKDKPGMYILKIIDGKNTETYKIIKKPY